MMTAGDPLDLRRVPVLPFTGAAVAGVLFALHVDLAPRVALLVGVAVAIVGGTFIWRFRSRWPTLMVVLLFIAALASYRALIALDRDARRAVAREIAEDNTVSVSGRVHSVLDNTRVPAFLLKPIVIEMDSGRIVSTALCVRVFADSAVVFRLRSGDLVTARGRLAPSVKAGMASAGMVVGAVARGELASVFADSGRICVERTNAAVLRRAVDRTRGFIRGTFNRRLSPDGAALCKALVLGDRTDFGVVFSDKLRLTGLSHVFALSGVNVGIVVTVAWMIFGLLFVPRSARLALTLAIALFYMELGREAPSLVRASLMAVFLILGALLHRRGSAYNSIASAALVELLWRPLDLVDAGFLLSYLAVLGILAGLQVVRPRLMRLASGKRAGPALADIASATVCAQVATLPLVGFVFHRIPLLGVVGNLLAVPLFAVMLLWSLLLLLVEAILPAMSGSPAGALDMLALVAGHAVHLIASVPFAGIALPEFSLSVLGAIYGALVLMVVGLFTSRVKVTILGAGVAANLILWPLILAPVSRSCTVTFFAVGNGDAALIATPRGKHVLVDAGPAYGGWSAASRILPYLMDHRVAKLDAMILTHADRDHIGGAAGIIGRIPVGQVFAPRPGMTRTFLEFELTQESYGLRVLPLAAGQKLQLDQEVSLIVLSPDSQLLAAAPAENAGSLVMRLDCGGSSVLFTGDIDSLVEYRLLAWGDLTDVDVLKVSHHGAKSATCGFFLDRVTPQMAVVSVGRRSHYGHPDEGVIRRLAAHGVRVMQTNRDGDITLAAAGGGWVVLEQPGQRLIRRWKLGTVADPA